MSISLCLFFCDRISSSLHEDIWVMQALLFMSQINWSEFRSNRDLIVRQLVIVCMITISTGNTFAVEHYVVDQEIIFNI
jgi:hypothetical protein